MTAGATPTASAAPADAAASGPADAPGGTGTGAGTAGRTGTTGTTGTTGAWRVVAAQECRDLWLGVRGPLLLLGFALVLSVVTYLVGTQRALNFLEQRETVVLVLQVTVAVGALLTLAAAADALSGERERGTLEALLLTPVPRSAVAVGKLVAAATLWLGAFAVAVPYLAALAHGVGELGPVLVLGLLTGTVLAVGLAGLGLLVSAVSASDRVSLSVALLGLLALFAPTQLPTGLPGGWFGVALDHTHPVSATLHYLGGVLVTGRPWTQELGYLVSPALLAAGSATLLVVGADRLVRLVPGRER